MVNKVSENASCQWATDVCIANLAMPTNGYYINDRPIVYLSLSFWILFYSHHPHSLIGLHLYNFPFVGGKNWWKVSIIKNETHILTDLTTFLLTDIIKGFFRQIINAGWICNFSVEFCLHRDTISTINISVKLTRTQESCDRTCTFIDEMAILSITTVQSMQK